MISMNIEGVLSCVVCIGFVLLSDISLAGQYRNPSGALITDCDTTPPASPPNLRVSKLVQYAETLPPQITSVRDIHDSSDVRRVKFVVQWTYAWNDKMLPHPCDEFIVEVSDPASPGTLKKFVIVQNPIRLNTGSYEIVGLTLGQTRKVVVKAVYGRNNVTEASPEVSGYTGDRRILVIQNSLPSTLPDSAIVGLRLHPSNGLEGTEQLTGTPPSTCVGNPATPPYAQISSGTISTSMDVNLFAVTSPYSIYIGLGGWDPKTPAGSCLRREYYNLGGVDPPRYHYFNFVVQDHTIGPKTLTVVVEGREIKLKDGALLVDTVRCSQRDPTPATGTLFFIACP